MAARRLGRLNDEVVYVGGRSTALFITDPLSLDVRVTEDVDCIIDVVTLSSYYQFCEKLKVQGFIQRMEDDVVCRWRYDDLILDVMPIKEEVLGFGNRWYGDALACAITHQLSDDVSIKAITAPYFLATKIEAFKGRGKGDFFGSHDIEDIVTVIAGRIEIVEDIVSENITTRLYLKEFFQEASSNYEFQQALPGHVNDGPMTSQRVRIVMDRIKKIIG